MNITAGRSFQRQVAYAIWVKREILHKTTDHHISWITQRDKQSRFGKKPQHPGNEHRQSRVLIEVDPVSDWFVQGRLHVVNTACALGTQSLNRNRIERLNRRQWGLWSSPHRRKNVAGKGLAFIGTHEA